MDIFLKSLASGAVTAIVLLIAKFFGSKVAGIVGGIPIVFAISYVFLTINNRSLARDFLIGGIYGAIAAIFFSLVLLTLNFYFFKSHWLNFGVAYLFCICLAFVLAGIFSK